jgi:hypothetical protein
MTAKCLKTKDKEKSLKVTRGKKRHYHKKKSMTGLTSDFSIETMEEGR